MASFGEGALTDLLERLRKSRDKSVNKRIRKGTKRPKHIGSHKPKPGRTRKDIMNELT